MVTVNKLIVKLQNQLVLKSVSCLLLPGRVTVFIGKSGAGKSTLLKSLAGLVPKKAGSIIINNKEITTLSCQQRSKEIGYVFQDFNLFPHFSVLQNCIDPLLIHGITHSKAEEQAREILKQLEMQNFIEKYPSELSGGQQQRVAIARALCLKPFVLLLDEPTASLDPENSSNIALLLQKFAQNNITIGVASHDMAFIKQILDRGYVMKEGEIIENYDLHRNKEILQNSLFCSFLKHNLP